MKLSHPNLNWQIKIFCLYLSNGGLAHDSRSCEMQSSETRQRDSSPELLFFLKKREESVSGSKPESLIRDKPFGVRLLD